jgi:molybdopterin converting factor small subunit
VRLTARGSIGSDHLDSTLTRLLGFSQAADAPQRDNRRMRVGVRLGGALVRLVESPLLAVQLEEGATLDDLYSELGDAHPDLDAAMRSALPVLRGTHIEKSHVLAHGDEVALLPPAAGG